MRNNWLRFLIFGALIASLMTVSLVVLPKIAGAQESATTTSKIYRDYVEGMGVIQANYVEDVTTENLTKTAVQGMLRTLDPHSNFFDRKSFEEMRQEQRSQYFGIGAVIRAYNGRVYIIEPYEDTPAVRAGLRYGDQIFEVDGKSAENWNSDEVRDHLRGPQGTKVKVTVKRAGSPQPLTFTIERDAVALPSISDAYMVRPGVGYVDLRGRSSGSGFHSTTAEELTYAINYLKEQGMTSMILDIRGNPGGLLDQAIRVCDKFLQRGQTVLSVRGRDGRLPDRDFQAESGAPENFPMVVLINGGSASASEIVAGAIQDHDRGLIIGETSFGKGLVQTIFPLSGGAGLTLTTARYYTPSGRLIQRDYSSGSFYEYIFKRNNKSEKAEDKPKGEEKQTDLGRKVFGGGGIEPDIKVADSTVITNTQFYLSQGLFLFVRELLAGNVATAPNFKFGAIEFNHKLKPSDFVVTDEILKSYREFMLKFMKDNPRWGLTTAMVDDNMVWARKQIRYECLLAAYGSNVAQRFQGELDAQLQRAISEMPAAAELAERARRLRTASVRPGTVQRSNN
ncbi:MAG TPA: S41 family peptidase [Blastocatellia bacterium]|nr:S41 family peptidase [Blastocatellia bacterium]